MLTLSLACAVECGLCDVQWVICTEVDDRNATCSPLIGADDVGISLVDSLSPHHAHEFTAYLKHSIDGTRAGTTTAVFTVALPHVPDCDYFLGQVSDPLIAKHNEAKNSEGSSTTAGSAHRHASLEYAASTMKAFALNGACKTHLPALTEPQALCDFHSASVGDINQSKYQGDAASPLTGPLDLPRGVWLDPRASIGHHQALLAHLVRSTEGPVIELGVGEAAASTPLLRALLGVANGDSATSSSYVDNTSRFRERTHGSGSDVESKSKKGSSGRFNTHHIRGRILVTVDDNADALRAVMQRLPPTPYHLYALIKPRSSMDKQTGDHWDRFFALPGEENVNMENSSRSNMKIYSCPSTGCDWEGDYNESSYTVSSWSELTARWGNDPVSVALLALKSRRGRTQALKELAHSGKYLVLPDSVGPPPSPLPRKTSNEGESNDASHEKRSTNTFWDSWLKVGVYEDSARCKGGPTTIVLTNQSHCGLPSGPEAWHQPKLEEKENKVCDQALLKSQSVQMGESTGVDHSTITPAYVYGQDSFPCYGLDFGLLSLKIPLMNGQTLPLDLPLKRLLPHDALRAELWPQFRDVCEGVGNMLQSIEECASDLFNQASHSVSSVCTEAFPLEPPPKPPLYIGLGMNCAPPSVLRAAGVRKFASPFDWTITPMHTVLSVLLEETQSLTGNIRRSIASDIDLDYTDTNQHTSDFFVGVPYSADLKVLFVHEDNFEEVKSKINRRLKRMMSQIHNPPEEGIVLVYHLAKAVPLLAWPTNTSTASAVQGIHEFAPKQHNTKATSLVSLLPDLLSWCFNTAGKQKQLSRALIARQFRGKTVVDGQTQEEANHRKLKELNKVADDSCGWLNTTQANYLHAIAQYPGQANFLRLLFEV